MLKRILTAVSLFLILSLLLAMSPTKLDFDSQIIRAGFETDKSTMIFKSYHDFSEFIRSIPKDDSARAEIKKLQKYDMNYFKDKSLILITLTEGSGSIRHKVLNVQDGITVTIRRTIPQIGTLDIAVWHIYIGLEKAMLARLRPRDIILKYVDIHLK